MAKRTEKKTLPVDPAKLGQGLKTTFLGVAMIFDSLGTGTEDNGKLIGITRGNDPEASNISASFRSTISDTHDSDPEQDFKEMKKVNDSCVQEKKNVKKIGWIRKLTSRKFWLSIATFMSMAVIACGGTQDRATQVASLIMAGAAVVAYIVGEGLTDAVDVGGGEQPEQKNDSVE